MNFKTVMPVCCILYRGEKVKKILAFKDLGESSMLSGQLRTFTAAFPHMKNGMEG